MNTHTNVKKRLTFYHIPIAGIDWIRVASVEGSVFTYMANESNETVWPGKARTLHSYDHVYVTGC